MITLETSVATNFELGYQRVALFRSGNWINIPDSDLKTQEDVDQFEAIFAAALVERLERILLERGVNVKTGEGVTRELIAKWNEVNVVWSRPEVGGIRLCWKGGDETVLGRGSALAAAFADLFKNNTRDIDERRELLDELMIATKMED